MFGLQKQSFESYLEELLAHCEWEQIEWPDNSEFLRLDPPFKWGYWQQIPEKNDHISLARYEVTSAFQDVTPGTSLDRPGLQALLSELSSKQFDVILVKGAERLIRNFRLVPQLAETFRRAGVRVISPLDTNDIFGTTPSVLTALNAE